MRWFKFGLAVIACVFLAGGFWWRDRLKNEFITLNGGFNRWILGKRLCNRVYLLDGDMAYMPVGKIPLKENVKKLVRIKHDARDAKSSLLYVQGPDKVSIDRHNLMGVFDEDGMFDTMDEMIDQMDKAHIPTEDLRNAVCASIDDVRKYFMLTDTHWNMDGVMQAFEYLTPRLVERLGVPKKYCMVRIGTDAWERQCFSRNVAGPLTRRVGPWFRPPEPFFYYVPVFTNDYRMAGKREYSKSVEKSGGNFKQLFVCERAKAIPSSVYMDSPYDVIGGGSWDWLNICNRTAPIKKRIMFVTDSYGRPVVINMSTVFRDIRLLDYRTYRKASIKKEIESWHPDLVVVMPSGRVMGNKMWWDFYLERKPRGK